MPPASEASPPAHRSLNESPSEKEGKSVRRHDQDRQEDASMKVPPKRKGNLITEHTTEVYAGPQ